MSPDYMTPTIHTNTKSILIELPVHADGRGKLCVLEFSEHCPSFSSERAFWVYEVPENTMRGGHAHVKSAQFHICMNGIAKITVDDGVGKQTFNLDAPNKVLFVPPMVWGEFVLSSPDAFLLVASSHKYDKRDYIRNYGQFLSLSHRKGNPDYAHVQPQS